MKNKLFSVPCALLLFLSSSAGAVDHVGGSPWNVELSGACHASFNTNVFYEEKDPVSDVVIHLIPGLLVEYEKFGNVLFEGELKLDSFTYLDNSDADVVETLFHLKARPIHKGGYFIFSEDYAYLQSYSPAGGLTERSVNVLELGGGYRGYHLDIAGTGRLESSSYASGGFSDLDYTMTDFTCGLEYLFESFYLLGDIGTGRLSYRGDALNDAARFRLTAGAGKNFYPKSKVEFKAGLLRHSAESGGDSFSGLVCELSAKHITVSGRSSFRLAAAKEIIPSSTVGADYTEAFRIRYRSVHNLTNRILADIEAVVESDTVGDRKDRYLEISLKGSYTPRDMLPPRFIRRKPRKHPKRYRPRLRIDAGVRSRKRSSTAAEVEFSQFILFAGIAAVY